MTQKVLANVWWPFQVHSETDGADLEKALTLWLNSTLGFILFLGHKQETEGPWVSIKKPVLLDMPTLNASKLRDRAIRRLAQTYDALAEYAFLPFPRMAEDPTRKTIDDALAEALRLPDVSILRELLSREPILSQRLDGLLDDARVR